MTNDEIISLAEETAKEYKKLRAELPYSANIITELHANENAHSRILRLLLAYENNGKYPIFESFIKYINLHFNANNKNKINITIAKPEFTNETDRIDILIKEQNKYAIIIENKVCGAVDQEKQIENYTEKCINKHKIDKANIYVLYLTRDGRKKVSDSSLSEDAKKDYLDYKSEEDTGRFLPIDYKAHILPWLEKEVLPNTPFKEILLISALEQYIDYIKEMLCIRPQDEEINKKMEAFVMENSDLKNKSLEELIKISSEMTKLNEIIKNIKNEKINKIGKDKIILYLEELLKERNDNSKITNYKFTDSWYVIVIENDNMKSTDFKITNDADFGETRYGIHAKEGCIISKEAQQKIDECNKPVDKKYQFNQYNNKFYDNSFWKRVEQGKTDTFDLTGHIFECYKKTMDALKDVQL